MDYQVWTHEEYEGWLKVDCGDKEAAMREIDTALRAGKDPLLTVSIPYRVNIKLEEDKIGDPLKGKKKVTAADKKEKEEPKSEATQGEAQPGESPGTES